jgi:hypothetical protein
VNERGIHVVREHLAKLPPSSALTIAHRRAQYDRGERAFPITSTTLAASTSGRSTFFQTAPSRSRPTASSPIWLATSPPCLTA